MLKGFPVKHSDSCLNLQFKPNRPIAGKVVSGDVGIEIEMEGRNLPQQDDLSGFKSSKTGRMWIVHTDGSLRNGGLEYVLDAPCDYSEVPEMVEGLFKTFDSHGSVLDVTQRTSTHIHINVSHLRANALTSYLALWYTFEEALVNWCGETRAGNLFCLRSKDSAFIPEQWSKALVSGSFRFPNDYKYSSLNLGAFSRFGSFEFRSLRGAENPLMVIKWANLLMALRREAETTFDNPFVIAEQLSAEGPDGLFRSICSRHGLDDFCEEIMGIPENIDNFNSMCFTGFRNIQKIIYEISWDKIIDKCREIYVPDPFETKKKSRGVTTNNVGLDITMTARLAETLDRLENVAPEPARFWSGLTDDQASRVFGVEAAATYREGAILRNLGDIRAEPTLGGMRFDLRVRNGRWEFANAN